MAALDGFRCAFQRSERVVPSGPAAMDPALRTADTSGMIDFDREQLDRHPAWRLVLEAYQDELLAARDRDREHDGWSPRLEQVDGVKPDDLARIHGKLIAFGYLKFQLTGRNGGVVYRLTPLAGRVLGQTGFDSGEDDDGDDLAAAA